MAQSQRTIEVFAAHFPLVSFPAGEFLFHLQKIPDHFLFIKTGCVKMTQTDVSGDSLTIHVFYEKSCISLMSLTDTNASYEFETLTKIEAYRIPRRQFIDFLSQHPEISFHFLIQVLKGMDGLVYRMKQNISIPAYERVASLLMYFSKHARTAGEKTVIEIALTHQDIADWVGLTRENVSIQMKKLERAGFISKKDHFIEIMHLTDLKKLCDSAI